MPSFPLRIELVDQGGVYPHLLTISRLDFHRRSITLYRDAVRQKARMHGVSERTILSIAILHEYLHFLFPKKKREVEQLSKRLERTLGII